MASFVSIFIVLKYQDGLRHDNHEHYTGYHMVISNDSKVFLNTISELIVWIKDSRIGLISTSVHPETIADEMRTRIRDLDYHVSAYLGSPAFLHNSHDNDINNRLIMRFQDRYSQPVLDAFQYSGGVENGLLMLEKYLDDMVRSVIQIQRLNENEYVRLQESGFELEHKHNQQLILLMLLLLVLCGVSVSIMIRRIRSNLDLEERVSFSLMESEKRVRMLLDSTGESIFGLDSSGNCTFVNPACLDTLGYESVDELLGKNMHDLMHHTREDGTHYPCVDCEISSCLRHGYKIRKENDLFWRKDGEAFYVDVSAFPIYEGEGVVGAVVTFEDVTEKRETQEALRQSEDTYARAEQIAHIGSWDWNIVTNELRWSDEIYRIFGLEPQEFGATYDAFLERIHPEDVKNLSVSVARAVEDVNEVYCVDHRIVRPSGEVRTVQENGMVYRDGKGVPLRMIGTVHDITERKMAEEAIYKLNQELEERVDKRTVELQNANNSLLEYVDKLTTAQTQLVQSEKMAALGGLVAGVAHEINTPVGVGVTAASHLMNEVDKYIDLYTNDALTRSDFEAMLKGFRESASIILSNLNRAAELVKSFKQVAVDQSDSERREFDLVGYINDVVKSLAPTLRSTRHKVDLRYDASIVIFSYPGAFSQIITNLVMNSLNHGFESIVDGLVVVDVSHDDRELILRYSDNGIGISRENLEKIFDPFFTTKRGQGGSGLGMNIVYNLVTQTLGGQITCESEVGKGIKVEMRLPIETRDSLMRLAS